MSALAIGIDDVTEYFLVGSFASRIVALGGLVLGADAVVRLQRRALTGVRTCAVVRSSPACRVQTRTLAHRLERGYSRSMIVTFAVPPPSHIVCRP